MEISRHPDRDVLTLALSGRLDAYWAEHLDLAVEDAAREGWRHIRADMSAVPYVSSAGLGILVKAHRSLSEADGSFAVVSPSTAVARVLEMVGLLELLTAADTPASPAVATLETRHALLHVETLPRGEAMTALLSGDPDAPGAGGSLAAAGIPLGIPRGSIVAGVGAFGSDPTECAGRHGELLAAGGAVVTLPTDGATLPDFQLAAGDLLPEVVLLYGLVVRGGFSHAVRFERRSGEESVPLSELATAALDIAGSDVVALAAVARCAGLVGAALKRSPAAETSKEPPFAHPGVRARFVFTPEPVFTRSIVLLAGVVARRAGARLATFLRPVSDPSGPLAHIHAAAFADRPMKERHASPEAAVEALFSGGGPTGLLHLLHDARPVEGAGESRFTRGTLWAAPITRFEGE